MYILLRQEVVRINGKRTQRLYREEGPKLRHWNGRGAHSAAASALLVRTLCVGSAQNRHISGGRVKAIPNHLRREYRP